ncbi:methyltransferase [Amycolatopsis sp. CA-230715]|uniref:methyltransferase n=1 Tax=Amycolatopsis sp. CA-230715 TaxID=2745196 RepID=UPI001C322356|nr:methyltransferase [Amycolatopsis sp. CA-230715]QWF84823.1 Mitomycin biosynthesis 6-O-methyltransferase [Amycolatopsis sp. CA-230715]
MTSRQRLDLQSVVRLSELADYIVPFTIRVVGELGVADELVAGPRPVAEIAEATGAHAPSLCRALRALAARGIFTEVTPETFALTPLAEPLRSDHPLSLRPAYPLLACDVAAWSRFDHSIRTGGAAFDEVHGQDYWTYLAEHPEESGRFDASQQAATRLELRSILPAYDWASAGDLIDVGGGNGAFLAGILARFKSLRGKVYDLPHVAAGAAKLFADAGVSERAEAVGGSFLESVPAGADTYLLKRVLYHWEDDDAVRLLSNVRAAMGEGSRLLVLEPVVGPTMDEFPTGRLYDLLLLAMAGGGARGQEQIEALLQRAGLRWDRLISTPMLPIIEVSPV